MNEQNIKEYERIVSEHNEELGQIYSRYKFNKRVSLIGSVGLGLLSYIICRRLDNKWVREDYIGLRGKTSEQIRDLVYKDQKED